MVYAKVLRLPVTGLFRDSASIRSGLASEPCVLRFPLSVSPPLPLQDLYEAGELKWGTDEAQFVYILGNRSKQHLRLGKLQKRLQLPPWSCAKNSVLFSFPTNGAWSLLHQQPRHESRFYWAVVCMVLHQSR